MKKKIEGKREGKKRKIKRMKKNREQK